MVQASRIELKAHPAKLGNYDILNSVGRGGMATVFRARHRVLGHLVAIKAFPHREFDDAALLERFFREARIAAHLRGSHISRVHEVGYDQGYHFLVMDLVSGEPLSTVMEGERLEPNAAVHLMLKVARAVEELHQQGVLHRDIKPANIMIDARGGIRVIDFGVSRRLKEDSSLTISGLPLGTPVYMAPEQIDGEWHSVTARSDVYSLGVILYELLTGTLPYHGGSFSKTFALILQGNPAFPRTLNPELPRDLEAICLKAMARRSEDRYASAKAFGDDLERFLDGQEVSVRPCSTASRWVRRARRGHLFRCPVGYAAIAFCVLFVVVSRFWPFF